MLVNPLDIALKAAICAARGSLTSAVAGNKTGQHPIHPRQKSQGRKLTCRQQGFYPERSDV
jgi:dolichol kinase